MNRAPLANRLRESLAEGLDYGRGDMSLRTSTIPRGRTFSPSDVIAIRTRRQLSQAQFAQLLAVSLKTLQSWEQGTRKPSRPTMRLLQIFDSPDDFRALLS